MSDSKHVENISDVVPPVDWFRDNIIVNGKTNPVSQRLICVTVTNDFTNTPLSISCGKFGLPLYAYWMPPIKNWMHWYKMQGFMEWLSILSPDQPVLYCDAADVVLVRGPDFILDRWTREFDCEAVLSGEVQCNPDKVIASAFPPSHIDAPYRYPCSGIWLAKAGMMREFLRTTDWYINDQRTFHQMYLEAIAKEYPLKVDTRAVMFQSMFDAHEHLNWHSNPLTNMRTLTTPAVIHYNGCKRRMHEVLEWIDKFQTIKQETK